MESRWESPKQQTGWGKLTKQGSAKNQLNQTMLNQNKRKGTMHQNSEEACWEND